MKRYGERLRLQCETVSHSVDWGDILRIELHGVYNTDKGIDSKSGDASGTGGFP